MINLEFFTILQFSNTTSTFYSSPYGGIIKTILSPQGQENLNFEVINITFVIKSTPE